MHRDPVVHRRRRSPAGGGREEEEYTAASKTSLWGSGPVWDKEKNEGLRVVKRPCRPSTLDPIGVTGRDPPAVGTSPDRRGGG